MSRSHRFCSTGVRRPHTPGSIFVNPQRISSQHAKLEARLMAALLAGALIFDLADPALILMMDTKRSVLSSTAAATALGCFGFGVLFLALAALLVPFLALQVGIWRDAHRGVKKLTCLVLALAGVAWIFLGWRCMHLHVGAAPPLVFLRSGAGALLACFALAFFLNAERLRSLERPQC